MPTHDDALEILGQRGVMVVPDFIANAGGIVAAAHSYDARHSPFVIDPQEVRATVSTKMRANATSIITRALSSGTAPHRAARTLAQERVRAAMSVRGQLGPFVR